MDIISNEEFIIVEKKEDKSEEIYRESMTYWQDAWRRLKQNKVAIVALIVILLLTVMSIIGPAISQFNWEDVNLSNAYKTPDKVYWFGTDKLGRDLWCRVWMGGRVSLIIALTATLVQTFIGIVIGGISGYVGGVVDTVIMRIVDILYSIPFLIYVILIMIVLGSGVFPIIIAFAITGWATMARLVRGQILQIKEQDYITAVKGLGASGFRIILKHLVPNMSGVIIVTLTMRIPEAIFTEAYLSYIGIGVQPPLTSWGQLANAGAKVMSIYPYQLLVPAFFISIMMLSLQLFGDGLRDALDPKLRK